jgi:hypothetical protein
MSFFGSAPLQFSAGQDADLRLMKLPSPCWDCRPPDPLRQMSDSGGLRSCVLRGDLTAEESGDLLDLDAQNQLAGQAAHRATHQRGVRAEHQVVTARRRRAVSLGVALEQAVERERPARAWARGQPSLRKALSAIVKPIPAAGAPASHARCSRIAGGTAPVSFALASSLLIGSNLAAFRRSSTWAPVLIP